MPHPKKFKKHIVKKHYNIILIKYLKKIVKHPNKHLKKLAKPMKFYPMNNNENYMICMDMIMKHQDNRQTHSQHNMLRISFVGFNQVVVVVREDFRGISLILVVVVI